MVWRQPRTRQAFGIRGGICTQSPIYPNFTAIMPTFSAIIDSVYPLKGISVKLSRAGYKLLSRPFIEMASAMARCLSISPPPRKNLFAIRQEVHLSVAASVISPLHWLLGLFRCIACTGGTDLVKSVLALNYLLHTRIVRMPSRFHYQAHP